MIIKNFFQSAFHGLRFKVFKIAPELVIKRQFKRRVGYVPDLQNPETFNEKLQWLKLYWRDARAKQLADKVLVRDYVKSKGLGFLLNEIYGIFEHPAEIEPEKLPDEFVIKTNHGSGQVIICHDKDHFDWLEARGELLLWMKRDYYHSSLEWVYEGISPKIIIEKKIKTIDGKSPKDYKFFCFSGEPKCLFVASDRGEGSTKFDFFDLQWNRWAVKNHYPNFQGHIQCPEKLEDMIRYAKLLSGDFPHVRIDFYFEGGEVIFGECTFFHFSGQEPFDPIVYDYKLGTYLHLPNK